MNSSFGGDYLPIAEYDHVDEDIFADILQKGEPVILKNCSFGKCMKSWTLDYLREKLAEQTVTIHQSQETDLNFIEKNFKYKQCAFAEFADMLSNSQTMSSVYLRSTNREPRAKKPARIEDDFPNIKDDLQPPPFIPYGQESKLYHSSVMRIASPSVQIWTHFDLYDNVLCQVFGTKRVYLIPPSDTKFLYVVGDKSRLNNFENLTSQLEEFPLAKNAKIHKCILEPGFALFIPALWWHNIRTFSRESNLQERYSIGFNIFWRDKELEAKGHYANNDVYGNNNLKPYDAALTNLDKALAHLDKLPEKYKNFYKFMLLERLKNKLSTIDCN